MRVMAVLNEAGTIQRCLCVRDDMTIPQAAALLGYDPERCFEVPGGLEGWGLWDGRLFEPYRQVVGAYDPENPDLFLGYQEGRECWYEERPWRCMADLTVHPPSLTLPTTWLPLDGTPVALLPPAAFPVGHELHVGEQWYRCEEATTFLPAALPSAWVEIDGPGGEPVGPPDGPQPWVQPAGSQDAYPAGSVVTHNGATWANTHGDGNVWEPGVFGWTEVDP